MTGKIVAVVYGDTIPIHHNDVLEKIVLYSIDTPIKRLAFENKVKKMTNAFTRGWQVAVDPVK